MTVSEPVSKSYIAAARYDIGTNRECSRKNYGYAFRQTGEEKLRPDLNDCRICYMSANSDISAIFPLFLRLRCYINDT